MFFKKCCHIAVLLFACSLANLAEHTFLAFISYVCCFFRIIVNKFAFIFLFCIIYLLERNDGSKQHNYDFFTLFVSYELK